jgi:hypothetical protein
MMPDEGSAPYCVWKVFLLVAADVRRLIITILQGFLTSAVTTLNGLSAVTMQLRKHRRAAFTPLHHAIYQPGEMQMGSSIQ